MTLTNNYCLVGRSTNDNFLRLLLENLDIPVCETTINSVQVVGSLSTGNKNGLLLPSTATDQELIHIRNSIPDSVIIKRIDERLNALGNVILCNDNVYIIHADLDRDTEDEISRVLGVPVYRSNIGTEPLVGSFAALNNQGMLVHPGTTEEMQKKLSELLEVNVIAGTVNSGNPVIGGGLAVNDWTGFVGNRTTNIELAVIESIFELSNDNDLDAKKEILIDEIVD